MKCEKCRYKNIEADSYCIKCGHDLGSEHQSFTLASSFKGYFAYQKGRHIKSILTSLLIMLIVIIVAFVVLGTIRPREETRFLFAAYALIFFNVLPFMATMYMPDKRSNYLAAILITLVVFVTFYSLGVGLSIFVPSIWASIFYMNLFLRALILVIMIPVFSFTLLYRSQNDMTYLHAFVNSISLIRRNIVPVIMMTVVLSALTGASFAFFIVPAIFFVPVLSYAWSIFHRNLIVTTISQAEEIKPVEISNV